MIPLPSCHRPTADTAGGTCLQRRWSPLFSDHPLDKKHGSYGRDETIAEALKAGAADYLVKPFSQTELTARVGAALRRVARPEPFVLGELAVHYEQRRVTVAGRLIELTAKEYELLRVLSLKAGRVVTYESLLCRVWSERDGGDATLVRNFVKKLRSKLGEDAYSPTWIFSVRGIGYRMASPREA